MQFTLFWHGLDTAIYIILTWTGYSNLLYFDVDWIQQFILFWRGLDTAIYFIWTWNGYSNLLYFDMDWIQKFTLFWRGMDTAIYFILTWTGYSNLLYFDMDWIQMWKFMKPRKCVINLSFINSSNSSVLDPTRLKLCTYIAEFIVYI